MQTGIIPNRRTLGTGLLAITVISAGAVSFFGGFFDQSDSQPSSAQIGYAETATPTDQELATLYDRSCRACHAVSGNGAPLTGHRDAWQSRLTGRDLTALVKTARTGVNSMPANGLCPTCSDAEMKALIEFMMTEGA